MSQSTYKTAITFLSVFSVVVLILGICLSIVPSLSKNTEAPQPSQEVNLSKAEEITQTIFTNEAESYFSIAMNMDKLKLKFPELLTLSSAGKSEAGREQLMFTLGKGEKKALIVGAIHAREHITTKYLLKVIEDYCTAYVTTGFHGDYDIKTLLDTYTLYIVPCANPDGLEIIRSRDNAESYVKISKLSGVFNNKI